MKLACVLAVALSASPSTAQVGKAEVPTLIRSFQLPGTNPEIARAELVRFSAPTTAAHLVDLVAEFVPAYGQAGGMQPLQMGPEGLTSVLFKFKDQRAIAAMVRAGASDSLAGPFGCRIFMNPSAGKPDPKAFAKIVHWCANAITVGNIDPTGIVANPR